MINSFGPDIVGGWFVGAVTVNIAVPLSDAPSSSKTSFVTIELPADVESCIIFIVGLPFLPLLKTVGSDN